MADNKREWRCHFCGAKLDRCMVMCVDCWKYMHSTGKLPEVTGDHSNVGQMKRGEDNGQAGSS